LYTPTHANARNQYWIYLTSVLTDHGPYEFAVSGAGDDHIDLANTYLFVEAQTVADDRTALDAEADVGPLVLSVLASMKSWFHHRPACTLTELT
jgi:hypothetical protein